MYSVHTLLHVFFMRLSFRSVACFYVARVLVMNCIQFIFIFNFYRNRKLQLLLLFLFFPLLSRIYFVLEHNDAYIARRRPNVFVTKPYWFLLRTGTINEWRVNKYKWKTNFSIFKLYYIIEYSKFKSKKEKKG